jgi:hypothetical protein
MRNKHIAALITFFVTFAFSSAFASLLIGETAGGKITSIIIRDINNGEERNESRYRLNYLESDKSSLCSYVARSAEYVTMYANKSGSMDASDLPIEFQYAWGEHMRAWRNYADFLQSVRDYRTGKSDFDSREKEFIRDINSTWYRAIRIAEENGADVPESAY